MQEKETEPRPFPLSPTVIFIHQTISEMRSHIQVLLKKKQQQHKNPKAQYYCTALMAEMKSIHPLTFKGEKDMCLETPRLLGRLQETKRKEQWLLLYPEGITSGRAERERKESNIIGNSHRKSNLCSLNSHWIFALDIFYLP